MRVKGIYSAVMGAATYNMLTYIVLSMFAYSLLKKKGWGFTVFRTKNNHVVNVFGLSFSVLHNGQACLRISLIETNVHFVMTVRNGYMKYMTTEGLRDCGSS